MAGQMPNMKGYSNGYTPPNGSAGGEAKGAFSSKSNPRKVPMKGSQINDSAGMASNSDKSKVARMQKAQGAQEKLRGQGC